MFKKIIWEAVGSVFVYKRQLAQALLLPFIIYMILDMVSAVGTDSFFIYSVTLLLSIMIQTIFAVTTHRIILLSPDSIPKWGLLHWSKREIFFTLNFVAIFLLALLPALLFSFIPLIGPLIGLGLFFWLFSRFSLVFPGIAVDHGISFKRSWELSKNRQMLMFLVVSVFPFILLVPIILFRFLANHFSINLPYTVIITSILMVFVTVFMVAALSVAYKLIYQDMYKSLPKGNREQSTF